MKLKRCFSLVLIYFHRISRIIAVEVEYERSSILLRFINCVAVANYDNPLINEVADSYYMKSEDWANSEFFQE